MYDIGYLSVAEPKSPAFLSNCDNMFGETITYIILSGYPGYSEVTVPVYVNLKM
jgi:hypothetical protein